MPKDETPIAEVTAPSGVFVTVYRQTFLRSLQVESVVRNPALWAEVPNSDLVDEMGRRMAAMLFVLARFDGERLTLQQLLDMDSRDTSAAFEAIAKHNYGPVKSP